MPVRSYRSAFILLFLVLLTATVLGVSSNAYRRATRISLDLSADIMAEISEKVVNCTVGLFERTRGLLESAALVVETAGDPLGQRDLLLALFAHQLQLVPQLRAIYVADSDGNFLEVRAAPRLASRVIERTGSDGLPLRQPRERIVYRNADFEPIARVRGEAAFDPRASTWFQRASEGAALHISEIYRLADDESPGVTIVRSIRDAGGRLRAAVGADVAVARISDMLAEQRLPKGGVVVLIDAQDRLIAYPHWLRVASGAIANGALPRVEDLTARWLVDAYEGWRTGSARVSGSGAVEYTLTQTDGDRYIAHSRLLPPELGTDWNLFVVVPQASLLSVATRLLSESAVISVIMLVVAAVAVSVLAVKLFEPLERLVDNTDRIRALRFKEVERVPSRFLEIRTLDAAMWRMTKGLESLEKFVPANVGRRLIESGTEAQPQAEVRELAVLFTGLSDLEQLCHQQSPEQITALLTAELDRFTELILGLRGTVDSYLGASVLAFWGAPVAVDNATGRACEAALMCLEAERALLEGFDFAAESQSPPRNLFSVHVGPCIVGAVGSSSFMRYTAVGDNVSRGWDLRWLNKLYGTRIIVSEQAHGRVRDNFWFRRLDRLPAGHPHAGPEGMVLFELVARRGEALYPDQAARIQSYEAALDALLARDWETAEAGFQALVKQAPEDTAAGLMLKRCQVRDAAWCPRNEAYAAECNSDAAGADSAG